MKKIFLMLLFAGFAMSQPPPSGDDDEAEAPECQVCLEPYNLLQICPCSHNICRDCLLTLAQNIACHLPWRPISCPNCRRTFTLKELSRQHECLSCYTIIECTGPIPWTLEERIISKIVDLLRNTEGELRFLRPFGGSYRELMRNRIPFLRSRLPQEGFPRNMTLEYLMLLLKEDDVTVLTRTVQISDFEWIEEVIERHPTATVVNLVQNETFQANNVEPHAIYWLPGSGSTSQ